MSDEEREENLFDGDIEKKPKSLAKMTLNYDGASADYLFKLNNWFKSQGYEPKYNNLDEYKEVVKLGPEKVYNKLRRAYNYFVKKQQPTRGKAPALKSYVKINDNIIKTPQEYPHSRVSSPIINQRLNQDFSFNQMGEENKMDEVFEPNSLFAKYYRDRSRGFKNEDFKRDWNASMNGLFGITGKGFNISHNPDYLRKDYFDTVVSKKHPDWKYSRTEDLDNDKIKDVVIRDGDNNVRYFNGYGLSSNKFSLQKQAYMTDPTTNDYDYKAFLNKYHETHPPKPKKTYADVVKAFVKYLENTINNQIGNKKATKMLFKNTNVAGRVESIVNRFVVLPTILVSKGYKIQEIEPVIFAVHDKNDPVKDRDYRILLAIYRDPELKDLWKSAQLRNIIAKVASVVIIELAKMITNDVEGFINTMFYTKNDMSIGKICYTETLNVIAMSNEEINQIDVETIVKTLTGK